MKSWDAKCLLAGCLIWAGYPLAESQAVADTRDEQYNKVEQLMKAEQVDDAMALLTNLQQAYPNDPNAPLNIGQIHRQRHQYAQSVQALEQALQLIKPGSEDARRVHYRLVDDYNELGQQRYFSPELCLRILYHLEQAWTTLVAHPEWIPQQQLVDFARKTVGHYDAARIGPNVRIREASSQADVAAMTAPANDPDLVLPPDGIDETVKHRAVESIRTRIQEFDSAQPSEYVFVPSDRTAEDILTQLDAAFQRISSIHYRKFSQTVGATEELTEETWYQAPRTLKTHQRQGGQEAWYLFRNTSMTEFDPASHQRSDESAIDQEPGWLMQIHLLNPRYLQQWYDITAKKLTTAPAFLASLYQGQAPTQLYLLTGTARDSSGVGYPPVVKVEYVADLERGLIVGLREYWHGVIGSGREEELGKTERVSQWRAYPGGVYLPVSGASERLRDDLSGGTERASWRVEIQHVNEPLNPKEFELSAYSVQH